MRTGLLIPADPELPVREVTAAGLSDLQALVGGYIEALPCGPGVSAWCDEEGKLKRKPVNARATVLWSQLVGVPLEEMWDVAVGDVAVFGFDAETCDDADLPAEIAELVRGVGV